MFNTFGDVSGSTLTYSPPSPAILQPLPDSDPTRQGRRLFEVVLTLPQLKAGASQAERERYRVFRTHAEEHAKKVRYTLVVAPTTAGPHRLLIWENGRVQELRYPQPWGGRYDPAVRSIEFYEQELHTEPVPIPPPRHAASAGQQ